VIAATSPGVQVTLSIIVIVLLFASGALAMAETSLVRTSKIKARSLADEKRRGAGSLVALVEHPERFLNPVLLLVLICQLVSATLIGVLASEWLGGWGILAATVFEVVIIFVFFEAVPKNWAVHHPERAALASAPIVNALIRFPPIRAISGVLIGLANLVLGRKGDHATVSMVTESELLAMADVARDESVIEPAEREFIHSVIDFGDTVVREVMVPRPDMVAMEDTISVSDALVEALAAGFSRVPIYEESIDDVIGIAYTKDLFRLEREGRGDELIGQHTRTAHFVPETKQVSTLLREMQELKVHQVIAVDEYGGTAGLVTLEDVIEELVGEIVDEFDVEEDAIERVDDRTVIVPGRTAIDDVDDLLDTSLPKGSWDTISGLLLDVVGGVPEQGEGADIGDFLLTAERIDGRRIERVRITRREPRATSQGERS
jgi:CBS domain containing-hemolysin-like protein